MLGRCEQTAATEKHSQKFVCGKKLACALRMATNLFSHVGSAVVPFETFMGNRVLDFITQST